MKTPEEIKAAVLKECERLEYNEDGFYDLWPRDCIRLVGNLPYFQSWKQEPIPLKKLPMHFYFDIYRWLNIEARELEERAKGLVDALEEIANPSNQAEVDSAHIYAAAALNRWKGGGK